MSVATPSAAGAGRDPQSPAGAGRDPQRTPVDTGTGTGRVPSPPDAGSGEGEVPPEDVEASRMAALVDELVRAGVRHAVVCPGSRSTPLALALAAEPRLVVHVRLDERSAAFTGLGISLAGEAPAVLCTTSGTATAEVHAAVVEAHHAQVPLLVCTADRPPELHDVGAPQTVDQRRLYGDAVRWSADPGVADLAVAATWRSLAARAVAETRSHPAGPGPVHLNLAFREPLVGRPTVVPHGRPGGRPWHEAAAAPGLSAAAVGGVLEALGLVGAGGSVTWVPGVVVAGGGVDDPEAVLALADALRWPVLADPRSGCRTEAATVVAMADGILRHPAVAARLRPAAVLRLGRPWASKVLTQWLDALAPTVPQALVTPGWSWADPGRVVATVVPAEPGAWCRLATSLWRGAPTSAVPGSGAGGGGRQAGGAPDSTWLAQWQGAEAAARGAVASWLAGQASATEPGVAHTVLAAAPAGVTVVLASSMPVRDAEWYGPVRPDPPEVVANRGANGIDGVVSTALGVALAGRPVVALVGDLAFLHDLTAWVRPAGPEPDLTVVVADNGGGGIFSFLPQADAVAAAVFDDLFATPQAVDVGAVAAGLGVPVFEVTDLDQVARLVASCPGRGLRVVRVRLPDHRTNVALHDALHATVAEALDASSVGAGARR